MIHELGPYRAPNTGGVMGAGLDKVSTYQFEAANRLSPEDQKLRQYYKDQASAVVAKTGREDRPLSPDEMDEYLFNLTAAHLAGKVAPELIEKQAWASLKKAHDDLDRVAKALSSWQA